MFGLDSLVVFEVLVVGPDAAAAGGAAAGTILESGQAPPLAPRDEISRKGKPLAPIIDKLLATTQQPLC